MRRHHRAGRVCKMALREQLSVPWEWFQGVGIWVDISYLPYALITMGRGFT